MRPAGLCPCGSEALFAVIHQSGPMEVHRKCLQYKLLSLPRADNLATLDLFRRADASKAGSSSSEQVGDAQLVPKVA